jgi:hypothetical protein
MIALIVTGAIAFIAGHYLSPWIDSKLADLTERFDPDPSDDRNADRNRWE